MHHTARQPKFQPPDRHRAVRQTVTLTHGDDIQIVGDFRITAGELREALVAFGADHPSETHPRTCVPEKHAGKLHTTVDGVTTLCCLTVRRLVEGRPVIYIGEPQFCKNCTDLWRRGVRIEPLREDSRRNPV